MNIVKFTLPAFIFSGILFGCKEEFDSASQLRPSLTGIYLKASQTNFNHVSTALFTDNFNVECSSTSWQFTTLPNWIMIDPASGNTSSSIVLRGDENKSTEARTSIFYLESINSSENLSKTLSVSQGAVESSLMVEPSELALKGNGDTMSILVIANCTWNAKCQQEWVTLNVVDSNELSITADANPSDQYRQATIYINYGENKTIPVSITQYPADISSSDVTLKYSNVASKYDVIITAEIDWTAVVSDSWIVVNPASGSEGETHISIEVAPNTSVNNRTGYVAFKTGNYERFQIQIEQEGLYIETIDELNFRAIENSLSFEVKSNTEWDILSAPNWLSFSKIKGYGNEEITVSAAENPNLEQRSGTIEIGQRGLTLKCEISVTQSGMTLSSDSSLLEFSDKGGQQTFEIQSDGAWSSFCSSDWFNASPISGNGDTTITVTAEENISNDDRNGTISYSFGNQSTEVLIHQTGKYFNIDNKAFEFDSHGGSHTISLSTNESWSVHIVDDADWLSLSSTSGEGDEEITLTVNDNPSVNPRSSEIIITPTHSQEIRITVNQKARYLNVSSESILFYSEGGTSEFISISSDGTYEIHGDSEWLTITEVDEAGFTVTVEPYKQPETRTGKITISLINLEEGSLNLELSVIQIGEGCSFIVDGYPEDSDWSDFGNSSLTFTITGFTSDQNWDTQYESKIVISITGYKDDENWNTKEKEDFDFEIENYSQEKEWN